METVGPHSRLGLESIGLQQGMIPVCRGLEWTWQNTGLKDSNETSPEPRGTDTISEGPESPSRERWVGQSHLTCEGQPQPAAKRL
jgi:hypothetical protein